MFSEWKSINEPPKNSGYVLLACTHHDIPVVLMGFCKIHQDGRASYKEDIYNNGIHITHWMPKPKHPYEK